jgi:hypothetical protein
VFIALSGLSRCRVRNSSEAELSGTLDERFGESGEYGMGESTLAFLAQDIGGEIGHRVRHSRNRAQELCDR